MLGSERFHRWTMTDQRVLRHLFQGQSHLPTAPGESSQPRKAQRKGRQVQAASGQEKTQSRDQDHSTRWAMKGISLNFTGKS